MWQPGKSGGQPLYLGTTDAPGCVPLLQAGFQQPDCGLAAQQRTLIPDINPLYNRLRSHLYPPPAATESCPVFAPFSNTVDGAVG